MGLKLTMIDVIGMDKLLQVGCHHQSINYDSHDDLTVICDNVIVRFQN